MSYRHTAKVTRIVKHFNVEPREGLRYTFDHAGEWFIFFFFKFNLKSYSNTAVYMLLLLIIGWKNKIYTKKTKPNVVAARTTRDG